MDPAAVAWIGCVGLMFGMLALFAAQLAGLGRQLSRYSHNLWLKRTRPPGSYDKFVEHFAEMGVSDEVVAEIHRMLSRELLSIRNFPVLPGDSLQEIYGVDDWGGTDLEAVIRDLAKRCGHPVQVNLERMKPPRTVGELVFLVASIGKADEKRAAEETLLRPCGSPAVPADALLRPAGSAATAEPQELLRPVDAKE